MSSILLSSFQEFASQARAEFPELVTEVEMIHDFEMVPGTRRPKVLVQTAAHVSGETGSINHGPTTNGEMERNFGR